MGIGQLADLRVAQVAAGTGLVQQVDGLIRQETVRDVALAQVDHRGHDGLADLHTVVLLVVFLDAADHLNGLGQAGLAHLDRLEAALQRLVLLDVFAVLGKGGGADHLDLTAAEGGLQDVARVHGALAVARAGDAVDLVDEQNHVSGALHLADQTLHPLLELAAELGAGHQTGQIQQIQLLALQAGGHLVPGDALGNALGDGGLTDARLTDQAGVVLLAAGQNLDGAVDFLLAADDLVQLAGLGLGGQVLAVFVQEFVAGLFALFVLLAVLFLLFLRAEAEGEGGAAAGAEAVFIALIVLVGVRVLLAAHGAEGEHAVLARFLHEAAHALLHVLQILVGDAELLHQVVHRLDAQLPGAGEAIALLLGLASLHALHEHNGRALFTTYTKHISFPFLWGAGAKGPA